MGSGLTASKWYVNAIFGTHSVPFQYVVGTRPGERGMSAMDAVMVALELDGWDKQWNQLNPTAFKDLSIYVDERGFRDANYNIGPNYVDDGSNPDVYICAEGADNGRARYAIDAGVACDRFKHMCQHWHDMETIEDEYGEFDE